MSSFIEKTDYYQEMTEARLDDLISADPTQLDTAETSAISLMTGYLNARYDTDAIFAATGIARNPILVLYGVYLSLYILYGQVAGRKMDDRIKDNQKMAIQWLKDVRAAKINPPDLPVPSEGEKDYIQFKGNARRENHI